MSAVAKGRPAATYKDHEVANVFPLMSEDEFAALLTDIKANGLRESIYLHDGKIIDGRNRYRACRELGIEPRVRNWQEKGTLLDFVISKNLHRRHLTSAQKAMVALDVEKILAGEAKKRQGRRTDITQKIEEGTTDKNQKTASAQAAKVVGTNRQYVSDAKKITTKAPEVAERVKQGTMEMEDAKALASVNEDQRKAALKLLDNGYADTGREALAVVMSHRPDDPKTLEEAASDPAETIRRRELTEGEKWNRCFSELFRKLSAVDTNGGMKKLAAKWGDRSLQDAHHSVSYALGELNKWKDELEKLMKERGIKNETRRSA